MSKKLVKEMWNQIGHKAPITVTEDYSLFEVCCVLTQKNIGALIVLSNDGQTKGVVSERDIIRANADKADLFSIRVSDIMTKEVHSVTTMSTHNECKTLMDKEGVRHLPVIEKGVLLGMVSMKDIIRSDEYDARIEKENLEIYLKT